jgi:hypothetical protein
MNQIQCNRCNKPLGFRGGGTETNYDLIQAYLGIYVMKNAIRTLFMPREDEFKNDMNSQEGQRFKENKKQLEHILEQNEEHFRKVHKAWTLHRRKMGLTIDINTAVTQGEIDAVFNMVRSANKKPTPAMMERSVEMMSAEMYTEY